MKNREVIELVKLYPSLHNLKAKKEFWLTISRMEDQLKDEIKHIQLAIDKIENLNIYEIERKSLCEKYASKDKNGKPIILNGEYAITNFYEFNQEMTRLQNEKYKKALEEHEELLNAESEINLIKLKEEFIPEELDGNQFKFVKALL